MLLSILPTSKKNIVKKNKVKLLTIIKTEKAQTQPICWVQSQLDNHGKSNQPRVPLLQKI